MSRSLLARIAQIWRRAPILFPALLLTMVLTLFFSVRLVLGPPRLPPQDHDMPIAAWMTPRFVGHSWRVPRDVVAGALSLERNGEGRRVTLDQLATERGIPVEQLIQELETAIALHREAQQ